jgi:lysophospholipase L1-like esterase
MAVRVQRALALAFAVALLGAGSLTPGADASLYLALGDSVSTGGGAAAGRGFVDLYQAYLRSSGRSDALTNLAVGGDTSSSMRYPGGQLDRALAAIDAPSDTGVLTLDIGGNDGSYGQCPNGFSSAPCPFGANYAAIVGALATALANDPGDETFQVMQYYNPANGTGSTTEERYNLGLLGSDARVDCAGTGAQLGLNDLIACIGRDHGAVAVDTYPTFKAHGQAVMADSLHPNEVGHAYIACLFEYPGAAGSAIPCAPDQVAPLMRLSGRRTQRVLRRRGISVVVRTDEESVVTVSGRVRLPATSRFVRFRRVTQSVHPNTPTRITIRPTRRGMGALRRGLRLRRALRARIMVAAKDVADNGRRATRRITLVR